jgi:endo-1,4-beta-xylanase
MKQLCLFLVIFTTKMTQIDAQTAYYTNLLADWQAQNGISGGTWTAASDETTFIANTSEYGGNPSTTVAVTGQPFTKAEKKILPSAGTNPWDAAWLFTNNAAIAAGDRLVFQLYVRSTGVSPANATLFVEKNVTFEKQIYLKFEPVAEWTKFVFRFQAPEAYAVGQLRFGLHLGQAAQTVEIGGGAVRNFKQLFPLTQLPNDLHQKYAGMEPDAPWRAEADARIEQIRKADLTVKMVNPSGQPVQNATFEVEMMQHQFGFGSAITCVKLPGNAEADANYYGKILDFDGKGHGFNEIVTENDLKWDAWESQWFVSNAKVVSSVKWCNDHNIRVRGHNLLWPGYNLMPTDMAAHKTDLAYLKTRLSERVTTMLTKPGLTYPNVVEWDAINEMTANEELANSFKGTAGYPKGREIYVDFLKKCKAVSPNMPQYLNDYVTLDGGNVPGTAIFTKCHQFIKEIYDANGPFDGIGFQAHVGGGLISIYDAKIILDSMFNSFHKRAKITEFDLDKTVGDSLAARFTGDLLTLAYSHPSVDAFLSWGFWDGNSWIGSSPYFYENWGMKPAAKTVADLLFQKWWTPKTTLTTNASGEAKIRGFKGKYRVKTLCNGQIIATDTVNLVDNLSLQKVCATSPTDEINDVSANFIQFQNPVKSGEILQISLKKPLDTLFLFAADGRLVQKWDAPNGTISWPVSVAAGVYELRGSPNGVGRLVVIK